MSKDTYIPTDDEYNSAIKFAISSAKTGEPACMICGSKVDSSKVFVCDYGAICDKCRSK